MDWLPASLIIIPVENLWSIINKAVYEKGKHNSCNKLEIIKPFANNVKVKTGKVSKIKRLKVKVSQETCLLMK